MNPDPDPSGCFALTDLLVRTERLRIEALCPEHFKDYVAIVSHPEVGFTMRSFRKT